MTAPQAAKAAPPDSRETVDGRPVLHVPDTAYDIKHMLSAMYDDLR